jgi:nitrogen fixation NifU-like protein
VLKDETVSDVSFEASACAICTASASVMTEVLKGKSKTEIEALWDTFHLVVNGESTGLRPDAPPGDMAAFSGVSDYPVRIKCAVLPWRTMLAALGDEGKPVTTE